MNTAPLAALAVLAASAFAKPAAADTCSMTGDPVVQVDDDTAPAAKQLPNGVTKVYASGAWTFTGTFGDGKPAHEVHSCFKDQGQNALKVLLAVPWKVGHAHDPGCTKGDNWQVVHIHGKPDFTKQGCDNQLDIKSSEALNQFLKLLGEDRQSQEAQYK
jgi:hypothetical protein